MASSNVVIITLNIDITALQYKHKHCNDPDWAISLNYLTNNIYILDMKGRATFVKILFISRYKFII